jgi:hypothetical protein
LGVVSGWNIENDGTFNQLPVNRAFRIIQCGTSHILLRLEVCQPPVTAFAL